MPATMLAVMLAGDLGTVALAFVRDATYPPITLTTATAIIDISCTNDVLVVAKTITVETASMNAPVIRPTTPLFT
jgi:hypothetical protein